MNYWIETDLEPDDVLSLAIFPKAQYYVVSEGNSLTKYKRMLKYCELLDNKNAIVIKGHDSDKLFPHDGLEFDNLDENINLHINNYLDNLIKFSNNDNPIMISIKPMRELLEEYIKDPDLIKKVVGNIKLYVYGGFNFRVLLDKYEKQLLELLKMFKEVKIYESFYVSGEKNSINKLNCPDLYNFIIQNKEKPFYKILLKLTYNWNSYLIDDIQQWIVTMDKNSDTYKRNIKIVNSIKDNVNFQFVLADFGLASVFRDVEPIKIKNLRFENKYTKFDETNETTNMYVYKDIPHDVIEKLILKYLNLSS